MFLYVVEFADAIVAVVVRRPIGERPFQCDECDNAFKTNFDLIIHIRKHMQDGFPKTDTPRLSLNVPKPLKGGHT